MKEVAKLIDSYDNMVVYIEGTNYIYFYYNKCKFHIECDKPKPKLPAYIIYKYRYRCDGKYSTYINYSFIKSNESLIKYLDKLSNDTND